MKLVFCGIDVAKDDCCAQLMDGEGNKIGKHFFFDQDLDGYELLREKLQPYLPVAGMEATGNYNKALLHWLRKQGVLTFEHNPLKVKREEKSRVRKLKTDPANAMDVARVTREEYQVRRPFPGDTDLEVARDLVRAREQMTEMVMTIKVQAKQLLAKVNPGLEKSFFRLFCNTGLAILKKYPTPARLRRAGMEKLTALIRETSHGQFKRAKAEEIMLNCCYRYPADPAFDQAGGIILKLWADEIINLEEKIARLDRKVQAAVPAAEVELLRSIPGIGANTAANFIAHTGPGENFHSGDQLVAFLGMDPSVRESGKWRGRSKLSKRGSPTARNCIYRSTASAIQCNPVIRLVYLRKRNEGRKSRDALSIASRHLARIVRSVRYYKRPFFVPAGIEARVAAEEKKFRAKHGRLPASRGRRRG